MEFSANSSPLGTEIWRKQLLQIPTLLGRLVYLASLRDRNTGQYEHPELSDVLGRESADQVLRHSHLQVFSQWIGWSLEEKKADLDEYLREGVEQQLIRDYPSLIPAGARDMERQLYLSDLETLLALVRFERDAATAGPRS
jgi:hypothetical protein